ncbi:MAG: hypothetical protein IPO26_16775 [Saprospiraceae bacterium]|nr:hypothetical protein [Saprospiraceae bacterium]HQV67103.1 right-handed parallel beta-helix repeat-containing protein [Saprospiraceae bacterium]
MNKIFFFLCFTICTLMLKAQNVISLYVNPSIGSDSYIGSKDAPFKTLAAAVNKVNASIGTEGVTIVMAAGVYAFDQTTEIKPTNRSFTKENRLTIRAEILPDDADWNPGSMPTIIHTMPLQENWFGVKDKFGGSMYGIKIEMSHVTIQGLKILGAPVVEHPKPGQIIRAYPISRTNPELDDLEITQCIFAGDQVTSPLHLGIIANGNGIVIDHCIFYNLKQAIVYWSGKSTGHIMRNTLIYGGYGCGLWTSAIANDFIFENNVIANNNYAWISQLDRDENQQVKKDNVPETPRTILYQVNNSLFAGNKKMTGTGGGPQLNFKDIDPILLKFNNTKITEIPIALNLDDHNKYFMHPAEGSEAATYGVGIFKIH